MIEALINFGTRLTDAWGYWGIFVTQTLESVMIPIPSEAVVTLGGIMASLGKLNIWLVILFATLANILGSIIAYYIGAHGGRFILEKYGKYVLITKHEISKMDELMLNHKRKVAFISRLLPGIRTFSSLIIGAGKLNFGIFVFYTAVGSAIWNGALAYFGFVFGEKWEQYKSHFQKFEIFIIGIAIILITWFVIHRIRQLMAESSQNNIN